jgi:hypothetical protein
MRRVTLVGACLGALCALCFAAAAAAEPVFFGKAEVGAVVKAPVAFKGTGGTSFLEGHTSKLKIQCTSVVGSGEVTGATSTAKNISRFEGCEVATLALPCENVASKVIETKPLLGELGAISSSLPGVRLKPESGEYLAEFQCAGGGTLVKVKGSVIASLSGATATTVEAGKLATSIGLALAQTGGIQKYTHFLSGPTQQLSSVVSEFNTEKGEYVSHEELSAESASAKLATSPAGQIGITK